MMFWISTGIVLALVLGAALVVDRRRGGGYLNPHAKDDHTRAAAEVEVNSYRQQNTGSWSGS